MKACFFIPSFYGLVTFSMAFLLYLLNFSGFDAPSIETLLLCAFATLSFVIATVLWQPSFQRLVAKGAYQTRAGPAGETRGFLVALALQFVGLLGIFLYARGLASYFGSWLQLGLLMLTASHEVRWAAEEVQSVGTQLGYIGWVAIWLWAYREATYRATWTERLLAMVQFSANLIYVDRTRPIWILFGVSLVFLYLRQNRFSVGAIIRASSIATAATLGIFIFVGLWVGKISVEGESSFGDRSAALLMPLNDYATGGFAYLNRIVLDEAPELRPARSLYPLFVVASRVGATDPPPPQVNEFLLVPVETNVGTFIEPAYRDAGLLFAFLVVAAHAFGFNWLARRLLERPQFMHIVAWTALCFCNLFAFFTPKFNNVPTWLFVGLAALATLRNRSDSHASMATGS
jgi:hypothetical protein